ncbi:MAG: phosphoadenylyl-sulfate reductase [Candidatus Dormibacteria bacterium]
MSLAEISAGAEALLLEVAAAHSRVALAASFQAESGVLIDMCSRLGLGIDVLTLDTGRLPEETHTVMDTFRRRYDLRLRVLSPDPAEVEALVERDGPNLFRTSVALRQSCCAVRKVAPLRRALRDYDAWITGLRRQQSPSRTAVAAVAADPGSGGITKVAPLVDWTREEVGEYLEHHAVPRHPLYDRGYTSIGCGPCTRAILPGEDERAGRWWWEAGSTRECGLHALPVEVGA